MVSKSGEDSQKINLILEAAQRRFGHYGLMKTTMNEIAEDIGMSKASLYYYFPDKENLFSAVIQKEQDEFLEEVEKLLGQPQKASELLIEYVQKRHLFFQRFLNLAKLKYDSNKNLKPMFSCLFDTFTEKEINMVERILRIGFASKEFEEIDVRHHAELFIVLMQGLRAFFLKKKNVEIPEPKDYEVLEKHLMHLTVFFIKGITLK